ncbi:beta-hexosaminidase [Kipferlia bialata]|uniref:beta-N-acetylhexosaminidase n=1 Tax=Kipferlia bialata TaxID=797122 RepID=A0A9K3GID5_9EUKA|nr:beta-hexosaminidase [Kipferlia bialata]|eukprot:g4592.t1
MAAHDISDVHGLWRYFTQTLNTVMPEGVTQVVWQETFQNGNPIPLDTIVQSWEDQATLGDIVKAGYRGLLSGGWYLDKQIPGYPTHYLFADTWQNFYSNEPTAGLDLDEHEEALILGGEVPMWGEAIDAANIDSWIWPRAAAVAERLWSQKEVSDIDVAIPRLADFRCQLVMAGVRSGPVHPDHPCPGEEMYW